MYAGRIFIADFWPEAGTGEYILPVFETSDVHGAFAEHYMGSDKYMLAYISDKVNDARSVGGGPDASRTVLIDGGDIFQGSPASELLMGEPMLAIYDEMGYRDNMKKELPFRVFRYVDDIVVICTDKTQSERLYRHFCEGFQRRGLAVNTDKSRYFGRISVFLKIHIIAFWIYLAQQVAITILRLTIDILIWLIFSDLFSLSIIVNS